jgi:colanic acid/amylovoran biosynthesis glycosyltransferase
VTARTAKTLIVMPSVPVVPRGDGLFMDIKMVEGLSLYAKLWDGPVRCLARAGHADTIAYGRDYAPADLPFEIAVIADDASDLGRWLDDAAVVLAAGDNHRDLPITAAIAVPVVFIIEYTLATRLKIVALDRGRSVQAVKSAVWTLLTERKRRRAFRASAGIQANGAPAFAAYRGMVRSAICYFDSRMADHQQIASGEIAVKRAAIRAGKPLRLAFSGRLEPMKGADHLIPVAVALRQTGTAFTLDIFGDGSLCAAMAQAIVDHGLVEIVRLRGSVPFDDQLVPTLKADVDLFLCCHRQDDPSCTYLETLSCGVPIVGYDNGAFAGVLSLGAVGIATPMDDPAAAAAAIHGLDRNRDLLAAMATTAADIGREHSFETTFAARIDHLRTVVAA